MKTYTVKYSNEAIDDLIVIYNYIAYEQLEPNNAANLINAIRKQVRSLKEMPLRNPSVCWSPWDKLGMRHFSIKKHIVFYLVDEEQSNVIVVRILSCRMNIPSILKDKTKNL